MPGQRPVRRHDAARVVHAGRGNGRQAGTDGGVLQRPRRHEGGGHPVRRGGTGRARHQHAGDRRARAGRGAAPAGDHRPPRFRSACRRGLRLPRDATGRGSCAHRDHGHQHGRLLCAARRSDGSALRRLRGLGRPLRLPRVLGAPPPRDRERWHARIRTVLPPAVGAGRAGHGRRDEQARAVPPGRHRRAHRLPVPLRARRERHHRACRLCTAAVRRGRHA